MSIKSILVTGANGFVGANLLLALERVAAPIVVHAWSRSNHRPRRLAATPHRVWHQVDITDVARTREALEVTRPDLIIHAAAAGVDFRFQDVGLERMLQTNVAAPLQLMAFAHELGLQRFIHLGSCLEYGNVQGAATESLAPAPLTLYGSTKAASSIMLRERGKTLGLQICVFRLFGMWGAFEHPHRLFPQVVQACRAGNPLALSRGDQRRDYSYVGDICEALRQVAMGEVEFPDNQILNLGSGQPITVRETVSAWARAFGSEQLMTFGALPYRESESLDLVADTTAATRLGIRVNSRSVEAALTEVNQLEGASDSAAGVHVVAR
jgi:nucleoside-diphosphate-sugar epimerase